MKFNLLKPVAFLMFVFGLNAYIVNAQTPANFKVAFFADQALGRDSQAVLNLVKSEGAQAVLHLGDFDYEDNPAAWEAQINEILGDDFPYFACIGNHDEKKWEGEGGYQELLLNRMNRLGLSWDGDLGVQSSFHYKGIFFVLVSPGISDSGNHEYIRDHLAIDNSIWKICGWHKNQHRMQTGLKLNEAGWEVYEEARMGGAIIATAHEHTYSRTHLLSNMEEQVVASRSDTLAITKDKPETAEDEGKSFVFVSGLGGRSIRIQFRGGDWWASIYTATQGANFGALFGTFNYNAIPNLARFYFKDIDGVIADSFYVVVEGDPVTGVADESTGNNSGYALEQNYPNPFNPETNISFHLPDANNVVLKIFNILGQEVKTLLDMHYMPGSHRIQWDGTDHDGNQLPSGVFIYRLEAGNFRQMKKMILIR